MVGITVVSRNGLLSQPSQVGTYDTSVANEQAPFCDIWSLGKKHFYDSWRAIPLHLEEVPALHALTRDLRPQQGIDPMCNPLDLIPQSAPKPRQRDQRTKHTSTWQPSLDRSRSPSRAPAAPSNRNPPPGSPATPDPTPPAQVPSPTSPAFEEPAEIEISSDEEAAITSEQTEHEQQNAQVVFTRITTLCQADQFSAPLTGNKRLNKEILSQLGKTWPLARLRVEIPGLEKYFRSRINRSAFEQIGKGTPFPVLKNRGFLGELMNSAILEVIGHLADFLANVFQRIPPDHSEMISRGAVWQPFRSKSYWETCLILETARAYKNLKQLKESEVPEAAAVSFLSAPVRALKKADQTEIQIQPFVLPWDKIHVYFPMCFLPFVVDSLSNNATTVDTTQVWKDTVAPHTGLSLQFLSGLTTTATEQTFTGLLRSLFLGQYLHPTFVSRIMPSRCQ